MRFRVLERDRRCLACGATPESGVRLHIDHVTPFSLGGRTVEDNLQALCGDCNIGKGNRSSADFRTKHPG
ncbi:MAG: HNH endonuclease [Gammaproteobacteria bacterium]|nr:HNH endonuclease [Gammaproteobacteria bacterium]